MALRLGGRPLEASERRYRQALVAVRELELGGLVATCLEEIGLAVKQVPGLRQAVVVLQEHVPDLAVLADDLLSGPCWEAFGRVREISTSVPLLVLCGAEQSGHVAEAFRRGADDHVSRGVEAEVLQARIGALLRRNQLTGSLERDDIEVGALRLDCRRGVCSIDGRQIQLAPKEFRLLHALAREPGTVLGQAQLIELVWGSPFLANVHNLHKLVQRLRQSLGELGAPGNMIAAARGYGYYLSIDGSEHESA